MSKEKHGFFGTTIKILMMIVFIVVGIILIVFNSLAIAKNWVDPQWVAIVSLVMGCLLFTSPFFLNKKRQGLSWVIKILMVIIFTILGAALIVFNSIAIAKGWVNPQWVAIVNLVMGCLLFTSPFFLSK